MTVAAEPDPPLHARIDALIAEAGPRPVAAPAADAEFLRRVYLDLTGTIPTAAEARAFLADPATDKRAKIIDRLLSSPQHARHLSELFDVVFMERRLARNVDAAAWRQYLYASFSEGKSYRQIAAELFETDGTDPAHRGRARFTLDRQAESNIIARDVGRIFFGRDLQCAQCHDHPLIDGYRQSEYQNLRAFFSRTSIFKQKNEQGAEIAVLADRAEGDDSFKSVFRPRIVLAAVPALPGGPDVADPAIAAEELYVVKPETKERPVPKYSRRLKFAELLATGTNRQFARTLANRLWVMMMGRGLIEPLDLDHPANPPSNPQLLDLLTEAVIAADYKIDAILRELALTQAYQRSMDMPAAEQFAADFPAAEQQLATVTAEHRAAKAALSQAEDAFAVAEEAWEDAKVSIVKLTASQAEATATFQQAQATQAEAAKALAEAQSQLAARAKAQQAIAEAAEKAQAAAQIVPDKAELAQAAQMIKAAMEASVAEVQAMEKLMAERTASMEASAAALASAQQSQAALAAELQAAARTDATATAALDAAFELRNHLQTSLQLLQEKIESLTAVLAYRDRLSEASQVDSQRTAAEAQLAENRTKLAALEPSLTEQQRQIEQGTAHATRAAEALADTQKHIATLEKAIAALRKADQRITVARQNASEAAELTTTAEQLTKDITELSSELDQARGVLAARTAANASAQASLGQVRDKLAALQTQKDSLAGMIGSLEQQVAGLTGQCSAAKAQADIARESLVPHWSRQAAVRALRPLSAEQVAWSAMQATGIIHQYTILAETELKFLAAQAVAFGDPAAQHISPREIERLVTHKLTGSAQAFVHHFGAGAGQPQDTFHATVEQALFMANSGVIQTWVRPTGSNLAQRLVTMTDANAIVEEIYLSVLTRYPSHEEAQALRDLIAARGDDRVNACADAIWSLLASAEFRFNH